MTVNRTKLTLLNSLGDLLFDNRFTRDLPEDPISENQPRQVFESAFSQVSPTPTGAAALIAHSPEVARILDLHERTVLSPEFEEVFSGNAVIKGMNPHAACYGGHQFGNWAGQLGDGRAITLGEVVNSSNDRLTLQLKGAGPTPYSRNGDGLAVLRSSLREFLCSESMFHLGVPTTRALSLCVTGNDVLRDMFYNGQAAYEPGAVVCRVAPSFIRFGNFEIFSARNDQDTLRALADHTILTHFTHLGQPSPETYVEWFSEVMDTTIKMIVGWQRVGFVHGVMNTDNMSIHGLTIDYGPYGWLDDYDPDWTPNTTDSTHRRYRFGNQPMIGHWNLACLANAIHPLVNDVTPFQELLDSYVDKFNQAWSKMMNDKIGLGPPKDGDKHLISDLTQLLGSIETDMTLFFRGLAEVPMLSLLGEDTSKSKEDLLLAPLINAYYEPTKFCGEVRTHTLAWLQRYSTRLQENGITEDIRQEVMNRVNPLYVLRNYLAQLAIDDAQQKHDYGLIIELLDIFRTPYEVQPGKERFAEKRPEWARTRAGCSQLSCSS